MKKFFSLFAAVLMAGSMMAEDGWIKFSDVQPATEVAGSTYGSNGFTLVIPTESDKATVDANSCTFGLSAEETVPFTHRLKTGGASSKAGRKFTLNIPEEGPLAIYARSSSKDATNRNIVIANGSDTIVNHICLDTDTVEGASSKIFLPFIVENVPAGSYTITYPVDGINIYGFQMPVEEEEEPVTLGTFFISSAEINSGKVGDIALGNNTYGSQDVANPATWYTCAKGDYTFKGAKVCMAAANNGGGLQMQGNASDVAKMGFFGNATAFNNIHSVKVVLRTASTATYAPVFNLYTDSLRTTNAIASADTVITTEGGFKKFVYTYTYAEPGKFFNIKDDLAGALYIDTIYVTYEKGDEPESKYDGTITTSLDNATISSVTDLANLQLTFVDATTITLSDDDEFMGGIYLQNKNGSEVYAVWHPALGHTYTINGNVVTLSGFEKTELVGCVDLPTESATLYLEDMGSFVVDGGDVEYFESAEIAYEAAPATTYTVTYTVTGFDAEHCLVQAGYFDEEETVSGEFVAGANTVPENVLAYVSASVIDDYTVTLKVNGIETEMTGISTGVKMWYSDGVITADMTIEVIFTAPKEEGDVTKVTKTMAQIVDENKYTLSEGQNATCYTSFKLDEVVTVSTTGKPNCGSFWSTTMGTDWRLYQTQGGDIKIAVAEGYELVSITIDYYNSNNGELTGLPYNTKAEVSGSEKTYVVGNSGTKTNGQVRVLSISVEYQAKTPTALQNTTAVKAVKVIENGNVVIIRDGVRYNIMGARF